MRRLLIKELRQHRLYIAGAVALSVVLVLLGDPHVFWGGWRARAGGACSCGPSSCSWAWVVLAGAFEGHTLVRAVSAGAVVVDTGGETPRRPDRLRGGGGRGDRRLCAGLPARLSAVSRRRGPGRGALELGMISGYGFLAGWAVSCVVPGLAFSVLVGIGWMTRSA